MFCDATWTALAVNLRLSRRELEIVRGIFNDQKEQAIAAELGVSRHTVHTERQRLYRKLGVRDRPQLILRVVAQYHGLNLDGAGLPPVRAFPTTGHCPPGV